MTKDQILEKARIGTVFKETDGETHTITQQLVWEHGYSGISHPGIAWVYFKDTDKWAEIVSKPEKNYIGRKLKALVDSPFGSSTVKKGEIGTIIDKNYADFPNFKSYCIGGWEGFPDKFELLPENMEKKFKVGDWVKIVKSGYGTSERDIGLVCKIVSTNAQERSSYGYNIEIDRDKQGNSDRLLSEGALEHIEEPKKDSTKFEPFYVTVKFGANCTTHHRYEKSYMRNPMDFVYKVIEHQKNCFNTYGGVYICEDGYVFYADSCKKVINDSVGSMSANKFKVGDTVIGNNEVYYNVTGKGWIGEVVEVTDSSNIVLKDKSGVPYAVKSEHFDLYKHTVIEEDTFDKWLQNLKDKKLNIDKLEQVINTSKWEYYQKLKGQFFKDKAQILFDQWNPKYPLTPKESIYKVGYDPFEEDISKKDAQLLSFEENKLIDTYVPKTKVKELELKQVEEVVYF